MDKRTTDILLVIIEEYVNSAEPVGSNTLAQKYSLGVSSATIRNVMHSLEQEGYITSLHTSSGRIPTEKGYRFYVDYLTEFIKQREIEEKIYYLLKRVEIEKTLESVFSKLFSNNPYTTLGVLQRKEVRIDSFSILTLAKGIYLLVLLLRNGSTAHQILREHLSDQVCVHIISEYLNEKLYGKTLQEIKKMDFSFIDKFDEENKDFFIKVITQIVEVLQTYEDKDIKIKGKENLLTFPDFKDILQVKGIFDALNKEYEIGELLLCETDDPFSVTIGKENKDKNLSDLSIAKHTYDLGREGKITFAIAGPTRMDYKKVMNLLNNVEKILGNMLESNNN